MVSSFIISPDYFNLPENGELVRESGIENRFNRALERTDSNFTVDKDDWSDGVIRYKINNEIKFYGIQECKRLKGANSIYERITQGLCYVYSWIENNSNLKNKFKFLLLPTEKYIDIIYLENLINSSFWNQFCFYYNEHRLAKGSASNFYKNNADIRALILDYNNRYIGSHREIKNGLDFKEITEEILEVCL